jgi:ribosome-associated protein
VLASQHIREQSTAIRGAGAVYTRSPVTASHGLARGAQEVWGQQLTIALSGIELAHRVVDVIVDRMGEDIVLLDLTDLTAFADYFVIATIDNERQMAAVVEALDDAAHGEGLRSQAEGTPDSGWVLIDVAGVVVHLFSAEQRQRYDLETLWSHAREVVRVQ